MSYMKYKRKEIGYDKRIKEARKIEERDGPNYLGFMLTNAHAHNLYRQGLEAKVMTYLTDDEQRGEYRSDTVGQAFRNILSVLDHRLMERFYSGDKSVRIDITYRKYDSVFEPEPTKKDLQYYINKLLSLSDELTLADLTDAIRAHLELVGFKVTEEYYLSFTVETVQPMVIEDTSYYKYSQTKDKITITKEYRTR